MKISKATIEHIFSIMEIISHAQKYLAALEIDQWQNGYPNEATILNDINHKETYLVQNNNNEIMATAMFSVRPEPTYVTIQGQWLTNQDATYGVIHRMAVHNDFRNQGLAKFIFESCENYLKEQNIPSMRIDTHQDNKRMQQLLTKIGYSPCGIIFLTDGNNRLAYEKLLI